MSRATRAFLIASAVLGWVSIAGIGVLASQLGPERHGFPVDQFAEDVPAPAASAMVREAGASSRPNLVVILADDLGYGDLAAYGGTVLSTPHIDVLAAEGLRFTDAYASASVCSPSRAGLLTGRYPLRSGIATAMQMAGDTPLRKVMYRLGIATSQLAAVDLLAGHNAVHGLPPSELTLPELLKAGGYRTFGVGKWHLGDFTAWPEFHPHNHGFDRFVGFNGSNDDFPVAFWRGEEEVVADIGADQQRYTRLFTEEAVGFLEDVGDDPFFLYVSHKDPHLPFFPSDAFAGRSRGGPYGDAVEELDWSVGEVLRALERTGHADDTIVWLTSDNGPWFDGSPGALRGRKGQSYEGGFRVPLIVRWPAAIAPGTTSVPTTNLDLLPTMAALAALERTGEAPPIDGVDLSGLLTGAVSDLPERPLFFFHGYDAEAMRLGDWKYVRSMSHDVWPVPLDKPDSLLGPLAGARDYRPPGTDIVIPTLGTLPMLYNVAADPSEAYDVIAHHPERAEAMAAQLEDWRAGFNADPRARAR